MASATEMGEKLTGTRPGWKELNWRPLGKSVSNARLPLPRRGTV